MVRLLHAGVESENGGGNLTHELKLGDKTECNNEYGEGSEYEKQDQDELNLNKRMKMMIIQNFR